jgi:uncharacterized protein (TIGR02246 family)
LIKGEHPMPAQRPEEVDTLFAQALNAGDLDALTAIYEPQAMLMQSPGTLVSGTAAIREALAGLLASKRKMTLSAKLVAQCGELAVTSAKWELAMTGPDGKPTQMSAQSVEVMRRQPDGRWRAVIDLPFGTGA